jgi:hypothetical protein
MKNIHILPTDKPSRLHEYDFLSPMGLSKEPLQWRLGRNIYITSDEYIGLSYYLDGNLVRKGVIDDKDYWEARQDYKKIILTTDQDLIKDGVQAIDDEFLEWFVKNQSCEEVRTIKIPYFDESGYSHLLIIPKEETKQETLEEAAERHVNINVAKYASKLMYKEHFIEGAKWQQEQIGKSEFLQKLRATLSDAEARRLIFEQFKKK